MLYNTINTNDTTLRYTSPQIKEIPINVRDMLCLSGNAPMGEGDYGDGGFREV